MARNFNHGVESLLYETTIKFCGLVIIAEHDLGLRGDRGYFQSWCLGRDNGRGACYRPNLLAYSKSKKITHVLVAYWVLSFDKPMIVCRSRYFSQCILLLPEQNEIKMNRGYDDFRA